MAPVTSGGVPGRFMATSLKRWKVLEAAPKSTGAVGAGTRKLNRLYKYRLIVEDKPRDVRASRWFVNRFSHSGYNNLNTDSGAALYDKTTSAPLCVPHRSYPD